MTPAARSWGPAGVVFGIALRGEPLPRSLRSESATRSLLTRVALRSENLRVDRRRRDTVPIILPPRRPSGMTAHAPSRFLSLIRDASI
jgi:hypothetical protein